MTEKKNRKPKPVKKKKPVNEDRKKLFGRWSSKSKEDKKHPKEQKEESVAGDGQVLQAKGALLGRIAAWALVAFVFIGAAAAIINVINPPATPEQVVESGEPPESQQAADHARGFVGAWLRATNEDHQELGRYIQIERDDITEEEATEFRDLSVASVETDDDGISTVIVSAEVNAEVDSDELGQIDDEDAEGVDEAASDDESSEETTTAWVTTWYQVNVFHDEGTFSPLGWPAPVPAPETGDGPQLSYSFEGSEDVEVTVSDFFDAYILGTGEVTRLTHPEASIEPLGASTFSNVGIEDITTDTDHRDEIPEDGTTTRALVNLSLGSSEDTARAATYSLTLETRGGRWEVRALDASPETHPDVNVEDESDPTNPVPDESSDTEQPSESPTPSE